MTRYASATEAARVAAEAAQIIRRNEAETNAQLEILANAKAEIDRHLSLMPVASSPSTAALEEECSLNVFTEPSPYQNGAIEAQNGLDA